jgi:hypothetical protein
MLKPICITCLLTLFLVGKLCVCLHATFHRQTRYQFQLNLIIHLQEIQLPYLKSIV